MRTKICDWSSAVGLLVMFVAAVMPLFGVNHDWVRWLYAAATVVVLIARIIEPSPAPTLRVRRLHRIAIMSAVLYCVSAAMLFLPQLSTQWALAISGNEWIAFLLAGAVLHLYASWVTDHELKKQPK